MNLIRKLGLEFFNEKFTKGMFILEGSLYLALQAKIAKNQATKEQETRLTVLQNLRRDLTRKANEIYDKNIHTDRYTEETYARAKATQEWQSGNWDNLDALIEIALAINEEMTPEYAKMREDLDAVNAESGKLGDEERAIRESLRDSSNLVVEAIDFANKTVVQVPENDFQSIRMFWDFKEGYRVLRTHGNVGSYIWVGPSLNGARCIKLDRRSYMTTQMPSARTDAEMNLSNYGYYLEEDRWKDILKPVGIPMEDAVKELAAYTHKNPGHEVGVLLEGNQTVLRTAGDGKNLILDYQNRAIAMMDMEGNTSKVRKGMLAIATKEGATCQIKK